MGRMRSWNSSEYESCGLQPYEISKGGEKEERREEEKRGGRGRRGRLVLHVRVEELVGEVCMSEGRT